MAVETRNRMYLGTEDSSDGTSSQQSKHVGEGVREEERGYYGDCQRQRDVERGEIEKVIDGERRREGDGAAE